MADDEYRILGKGEAFTLWANAKVKSVFDRATAKDRAAVKAVLKIIIRDGLDGVKNKEKWRFEGRYTSGDSKIGDVAVYVAKGFKFRVYIFQKGDHLYSPDADIKKRDNADPEKLDNTAKARGRL